MKKLKQAGAGLAAATLAAGVLAFGANAAVADEATDDLIVDIRVELDLPPSDGPAVFEALGVTVGDGPELTIADRIANPSDWGGAVDVDIDPTTQRIIISADLEADLGDGEPPRYWYFETVKVTITSDKFDTITLVSDNLFGKPSWFTHTYDLTDGLATFDWRVKWLDDEEWFDEECWGYGEPVLFALTDGADVDGADQSNEDGVDESGNNGDEDTLDTFAVTGHDDEPDYDECEFASNLIGSAVYEYSLVKAESTPVPAKTPEKQLPNTGANATPVLLGGIGLAALGAIALLFATRVKRSN